ncbi:MAG TPA: MAPEG family protein [Lichenihabitans sp.]|jgi:uncharacterized MAPEG superfamily protein|nr:MAPEG family protein [Lichenihabitans sp.]
MTAPLSPELTLLVWSVILLLAHIAAQGSLVVPLRGFKWNAGPRDEGQPPLGRHAGRAQRALDNYKETYPAFIALTLGLAVAGHGGGIGEVGAWLWFLARIAFLPLYLFGVPWLRSAAYGVSMAGLLLMFVRLL